MFTGMVISAAPANEYDKRVVLLTKERGKITVFARGAKMPKSLFSASTRPFCFGKFTLYEGKTAYNLVSTQVENYFEDITNDIERVYYGFYFLELADYFNTENTGAKEELLLLYQSLRALSHPAIENELIRRVYELKVLTLSGEYPNMFSCMSCGKEEMLDGFSTKLHGALCTNCSVPDRVNLLTSTVYTMQYVISSPIAKLYTFQVSKEVLKELGMVMNRFYAIHIGQKFHSLEMLEKNT